jgi:cytochrome c-type biogenesis protein CcmF
MDKLGTYLLWFAFILTLYTGIAALLSVRLKRPELLASARQGIYATFALLLLMCGMLTYAFYYHVFSLRYVAAHSSRVLATPYRLTALWSGMEGSLTFWALLLSGYAAVAVFQNRNRNQAMLPYVILTLTGIEAFFIFVQVFLANPFAPTPGFLPADGRGMNPQLQNPGMAVHPPLLYLGYVGCAIPFAFAMAALFTNRLDDQWIRTTRRWTITAWTFLSCGILMGSWWAYVELGWGGYWAWDPVENASLMPWLTATAYLHSVMIQEKRDMLRVWNMVLVFLSFFLSVMGTFLTRSGFVQSVHTFAESELGWYFLGFLILCLA